MKKLLTIALAIMILATTSSFAYAKGRDNKKIQPVRNKKSISTSLQKSLKSIAPKSTTSAAIDPAITAQATAVKSAYANYNKVAKQINTKKATASKLMKQIKKSKKTLTNEQYTALNALIAKINAEAKGIVKIKGLDNAVKITKTKAANKLAKVTLADLTKMLNSINANNTHLNTISSTYDQMNATLTTVANTTPAAVSLN